MYYRSSGPQEVTTSAGACKDRTDTIDIQVPKAVTTTIPNTPNTIFHLFACDDGTVKVDTVLAGTNLPAGVAYRWIGFALTNGTGVVIDQAFTLDDQHVFGYQTVLTGNVVGAWTQKQVDLTPIVPLERLVSYAFNTGLRLNYGPIQKWGGVYTPSHEYRAYIPAQNGIVELQNQVGNAGTLAYHLDGVGILR